MSTTPSEASNIAPLLRQRPHGSADTPEIFPTIRSTAGLVILSEEAREPRSRSVFDRIRSISLRTYSLICVLVVLVIESVTVSFLLKSKKSRLDNKAILLLIDVVSELSEPEALRNTQSVQYQALSWLAYNDTMSFLHGSVGDTERIIQRYAMAVLFVSMGKPLIDYHNTSECEWAGHTVLQTAPDPNFERTAENFTSTLASANSIHIECGRDRKVEKLYLAADCAESNVNLPPELQHLSQLSHLDIKYDVCKFKETSFLEGLTSLTTLRFSADEKSMSYKAVMSAIENYPDNFSNMRTLELVFGRPSGTIPTEIGKLTKLEILNLHWSSFGGTLPTEIGDLANLKRLLLSRNRISGSVPSEIGRLRSLEYLDFSYNFLLDGALPSEIGLLNNSHYIELGYNSLIGCIPSEIGYLTALRTIDLSNNMLTGTLPSQVGSMSQLQKIDLSRNLIDGKIPPQFGSILSLQEAHFGGNRLGGTIPMEFGNLPHIDILDLSSNKLLGTIPFNLGQLAKLDVQGNSLYTMSTDLRESHISSCEPAMVHFSPQLCDPGFMKLELFLKTNQFPGQLAWAIVDRDGNIIIGKPVGSYCEGDLLYKIDACLRRDRCYTLALFASFGDGMCCTYGQGFYRIVLDGIQIARGGSYNLLHATRFGSCA